MDLLYLDLDKKQYTNVELCLIDSTNSLKISCHKLVLDYSPKYFHCLFNFNKQNGSFYEIMVDDVKIAHDIILSFYNQKINSTNYPQWKYLLKTFKCRNYFSLDNDISLLYNLIVPSEGFELLLKLSNYLILPITKN